MSKVDVECVVFEANWGGWSRELAAAHGKLGRTVFEAGLQLILVSICLPANHVRSFFHKGEVGVQDGCGEKKRSLAEMPKSSLSFPNLLVSILEMPCGLSIFII